MHLIFIALYTLGGSMIALGAALYVRHIFAKSAKKSEELEKGAESFGLAGCACVAGGFAVHFFYDLGVYGGI